VPYFEELGFKVSPSFYGLKSVYEGLNLAKTLSYLGVENI
jgi:hypothetical protein